ncbi:hypothetical protein [Mycoplasma zalophi]|uniref:Uncharacterized protein n=1 Tax=Mycoplasma zalophi TaxID=191287 RepID=A0ABS6DPD9_9MOLU|nr:hypothetical protein [Mycoplasma zalophi]MBU4691159.1 hypothetical protein [Mycoplasma zalophi]MBU4692069.1 hypothetical protein [Mycoplasma zalophi]
MEKIPKDYFVDKYVEFIKKLCIKYNQIPTPFEKLKISDFIKIKNYKVTSKMWKYQRHHIDEMWISGAILASMKKEYAQGLSVVCSNEEHLFLHYLIVCNNQTSPNDGMLMQTDLAFWDRVVKKMCQENNIIYNKNWTSLLSSFKWNS